MRASPFIDRILNDRESPRVLVLGDLILDRYTWGEAERISPEAPVVVLRQATQEVRPGGAASVAALLTALDAEVVLSGVVGPDSSGRTLCRLLDEAGIDRTGVLLDESRPTTTKERFVGYASQRHPHQILRVDHELRTPLAENLERDLCQQALHVLHECQAVLISDYAKGTCTQAVVMTVIRAACDTGVPVIVDPAQIADLRRYTGATILTPNRAEAQLAGGRNIVTDDDAISVGRELCRRLQLQAVVLTLDRDGIVLVRNDGAAQVFPTSPQEIYDITGAGDTVAAVIALCAGRIDVAEAVPLANIAAGLQLRHVGVVPISRAELRQHLHDDCCGGRSRKIVSPSQLEAVARTHRQSGRKIVFTNGCFDLLHVGHVHFLQQAAALGDVLLVGLNSDASVRQLKGDDRPVVGEHDRAELLAALECVDHVSVFDADTPHDLLRAVRPDVLVKGGTTTEVVGREVVEAYGGQVCLTDQFGDMSTTFILQSVR